MVKIPLNQVPTRPINNKESPSFCIQQSPSFYITQTNIFYMYTSPLQQQASSLYIPIISIRTTRCTHFSYCFYFRFYILKTARIFSFHLIIILTISVSLIVIFIISFNFSFQIHHCKKPITYN